MVKIVEPSYRILTPINGKEILQHIEKIARTCYKSEDRITEDGESAKKLIKSLIELGHTAMIEHYSISVQFTTDTGFLKDITRHRLASFAAESTRWCNYSKGKFDNQISVIKPVNIQEGSREYEIWLECMKNIEKSYMEMAELGCAPDQMRMLLPHSTKTDINITANIREWRHIFKIRLFGHAHPSIKQLLDPLLKDFQKEIPILFDNI